ncbi:MAG: hypothetical protein ACI4LX_09665 [Treponema sp.]
MTLYDKFEEIIRIHSIDILDYSDWCKSAFRKSGFTEEDIETKLFFLLMEKNIPLQIRIVVYGKNLQTDYAIAVTVYSKVFQNTYVPNKYEKILLNHINAIIHIFKDLEIIKYEYSGLKEKNFITELEPAVKKMLELYTSNIFARKNQIKAVLKDISGNELSDNEIQSFIVFITAVENENVGFTAGNPRNEYFLKLLERALKNSHQIYKPFLNKFNATILNV